MISAPRLRMAATSWFMRGAISPTRSVAALHQCLSHMSQMTTAVCLGCQRSFSSTTLYWPLSALVSTRLRPCRTRSAAWSENVAVSNQTATNRVDLIGFIVLFFLRRDEPQRDVLGVRRRYQSEFATGMLHRFSFVDFAGAGVDPFDTVIGGGGIQNG